MSEKVVYEEIVADEDVFNMLKCSKQYGLYELFYVEAGLIVDNDDDNDDSTYEDYDERGDAIDSSDSSDVEFELSEEFEDYEGSDDDIFRDIRGDMSGKRVDKQVECFQELPNNVLSGDDFTEFNEEACMENPQLCLGMRFSNVYIFRKALKEWAIRQGFDYVLVKNTTKTMTALCKLKCGFKMHASIMRKTKTFQIKTFKPNHECPRDNINRLVDSGYIANKYMA
ncbi:hypothetical protein M5689_010911 [Euphorbia peplus]|nr:hypothetical protein M5689_010911 [Euphorbia peplus]